MRAVIQRVSQASVSVDDAIVGQIGAGMLVLLGIAAGDDEATANQMAEKIANLRIFAAADGRFQYSLLETGGSVLLVSQFTLCADVRKGRRPSFAAAAAPELAAPLVEACGAALQQMGIQVAGGVFGAMMQVALVNDGPVTIVLDSSMFAEPRRS
jgi:D-tyrosyl-tRNA(Tyr) deacylase